MSQAMLFLLSKFQYFVQTKDMNCLPSCPICLIEITQTTKLQLKCNHIFCIQCVRKYIEVLRMYHLLTPQKLCCLEEGCKQQISDEAILQLYPGQLGFIFNVIKKRYRQSKDPNIIIFDCKGYTTKDSKHLLIKKSSSTSKFEQSKQITQLCLKILNGESQIIDLKSCKNIISFNKNIPRKQKYIQCNICYCGYCIVCMNFLHDGNCLEKKVFDFLGIENKINKFTHDNFVNDANEIDNYLQRNGLLRCLNPKCRVGIAKEEGCFWVKCRCSWEMCYPCQKLWGDCEHFKYYPYKKFVPPSLWMVRALNLY